MIEIYAVKYPVNFHLDIFNLFLSYVDKERQDKIKECKNFKQSSMKLLGDALIRHIVTCKYNIKFRDIKISRNEFGKPFLENIKDIHFNISNSGDWVICSIDSSPIGIDIEKLEPIDYTVAQYCFSEEEYMQFITKGEEEKLRYFYSLWTLKESYVKAIGKGLSIALNSFSIINNNKELKLKVNDEFQDFNFSQYELDKKYIVSVCSKNQYFSKDIIKKDFNELYNINLL